MPNLFESNLFESDQKYLKQQKQKELQELANRGVVMYDDFPDYSHLSSAPIASKATSKYFPVKLHSMLDELEDKDKEHIVSWRPHGRCFMVHRHKEFVDDVLPCWFRQTQFASFLRQLNMYGFRRIKSGPDKSSYYHEKFLRGMPSLALEIPQIKGERILRRENHPNFYKMPYLAARCSKKTTFLQNNRAGTAQVPPKLVHARLPLASNKPEGVSPTASGRDMNQEAFHSPVLGITTTKSRGSESSDASLMRHLHTTRGFSGLSQPVPKSSLVYASPQVFSPWVENKHRPFGVPTVDPIATAMPISRRDVHRVLVSQFITSAQDTPFRCVPHASPAMSPMNTGAFLDSLLLYQLRQQEQQDQLFYQTQKQLKTQAIQQLQQQQYESLPRDSSALHVHPAESKGPNATRRPVTINGGGEAGPGGSEGYNPLSLLAAAMTMNPPR